VQTTDAPDLQSRISSLRQTLEAIVDPNSGAFLRQPIDHPALALTARSLQAELKYQGQERGAALLCNAADNLQIASQMQKEDPTRELWGIRGRAGLYDLVFDALDSLCWVEWPEHGEPLEAA